jgi:hypothetical protein
MCTNLVVLLIAFAGVVGAGLAMHHASVWWVLIGTVCSIVALQTGYIATLLAKALLS